MFRSRGTECLERLANCHAISCRLVRETCQRRAFEQWRKDTVEVLFIEYVSAPNTDVDAVLSIKPGRCVHEIEVPGKADEVLKGGVVRISGAF